MPHHLDIKSTDVFTRMLDGAIYLYTPGECYILRYSGGRLLRASVSTEKSHHETILTPAERDAFLREWVAAGHTVNMDGKPWDTTKNMVGYTPSLRHDGRWFKTSPHVTSALKAAAEAFGGEEAGSAFKASSTQGDRPSASIINHTFSPDPESATNISVSRPVAIRGDLVRVVGCLEVMTVTGSGNGFIEVSRGKGPRTSLRNGMTIERVADVEPVPSASSTEGDLNLAQLRDWHFRARGGVYHPHDGATMPAPKDWPAVFVLPSAFRGTDWWWPNNPIPATLDAADECIPAPFEWERRLVLNGDHWSHEWWAEGDDLLTERIGPVSDTGNKVRDLLALARLCRIAQGATP